MKIAPAQNFVATRTLDSRSESRRFVKTMLIAPSHRLMGYVKMGSLRNITPLPTVL